MQAAIGGIDITREKGFREVIRIKEGNLEELSQPNTLLIFEDQARKLEVKVGDSLTISTSTPRGVSNTADVRVVAIANNAGLLSSFSVYMEATSLRKLYQLNDTSTGAIMLYLNDLEKIPEIQERLRKKLAEAGFLLMEPNPVAFFMKFESVTREDWTGQKLDVTSWEDEISYITWTLTTLNVLTGVLIGILLVIIVVGIMNTMWIAIRERTREIGTLRAIGMQRGRVMAMFLIEAFLLGIFGTLAGGLLGSLVAFGLNQAGIALPFSVQLFLMSDKLHLEVHLPTVLQCIAGISTATTLAALYPAYRAARLKPVTAMHHIG
jgi:ABC-type lipoprotein release transport system permease subunit